MAKQITVDQAQRKQAAAVRFAENFLNDQDKADELADLTPEEYAERRGFEIIDNPGRRLSTMANGEGGGMTKEEMADYIAELEDQLDSIQDIISGESDDDDGDDIDDDPD